jgi:uncharacterized protein
MKMSVRNLVVATALLLLGSAKIPAPVPTFSGHINDYAGVLSPSARVEFEDLLTGYEKETSHQIGVLTVTSLNGEAIETFSLRVAKAWGLGRKGFDNGVLMTIAPNDRRIRIELGTGMHRYVSNAEAQAVIDSMLPQMRAKDFDGAVRLGLGRLTDMCRAFRVNLAETASNQQCSGS